MRSALAKVPELENVTAEPGDPGRVAFRTAKGFDFRKALDAAVAGGVGALQGYKVLD